MTFNIVFCLSCFLPVLLIDAYTIHLKINELNSPSEESDSQTRELAHEDIDTAIKKCLRKEMTKGTRLKCIKNIADKKYARSHATQSDSSSLVAKQKSDDDLFADDYIDIFSLREGNGRRDNFVKKKILRTNTDSDSESSDSDVEFNKIQAKSKPKRAVRKDPYRSMQGPFRIYEMDLDRRRRLPHFLPKRHYWDEGDFKELKNYWIHGPQGKYPGAYRIPY